MKPTKTLATKCYKTDFRGLQLIAVSNDYKTIQYIRDRYNMIEESFLSNTDHEYNDDAATIIFELFQEVAPRALKLCIDNMPILKEEL